LRAERASQPWWQAAPVAIPDTAVAVNANTKTSNMGALTFFQFKHSIVELQLFTYEGVVKASHI
jgi:hypothetical protein